MFVLLGKYVLYKLDYDFDMVKNIFFSEYMYW